MVVEGFLDAGIVDGNALGASSGAEEDGAD
jgi:hypothetical protein